jgi:type 1 glutamine amidotransferase
MNTSHSSVSGMTRRQAIASLGAAALGFAGFPLVRAATQGTKKVLFFTKSSDYEHAVIKQENGKLSYAEQYLQSIAPSHNIEFTFSKDGSLFSDAYLAQFDAFCFFTSGDLLSSHKYAGSKNTGDGNPAMTPAGKQALLDAVAGGKGFVGIHAAADTFHTGETGNTNTGQQRTWRYKNFGASADPYTRMIGAGFIIHGMQQKATVRVIDNSFPGFEALGSSFTRKDEWYSLNDFNHDLHVLLVQDTSTMGGPDVKSLTNNADAWKPYLRPAYPSTWARKHGKGRVFYTSMGHGDNGPDAGYDWEMPQFRSILSGGLTWASGLADADVTPNIDQVTPDAWVLPPKSPPVGGLPPKV